MSIYAHNEQINGGIKIINYTRFYEERSRAFTSVESFLELEGFGQILYACFFYPYPNKLKRNRISFKPYWIDILGNSILFDVNEENKVKFIENDMSMDREYIFNSDPYTGLSINDHIKIGKHFYVSIGNDNDTNEKITTLLIRGNDNHLRGYVFTDKWYKISPLKFNPRFIKIFYFLEPEYILVPSVSYLPCKNLSHYIGTDSTIVIGLIKDLI
jgi:hypothetical protein